MGWGGELVKKRAGIKGLLKGRSGYGEVIYDI